MISKAVTVIPPGSQDKSDLAGLALSRSFDLAETLLKNKGIALLLLCVLVEAAQACQVRTSLGSGYTYRPLLSEKLGNALEGTGFFTTLVSGIDLNDLGTIAKLFIK